MELASKQFLNVLNQLVLSYFLKEILILSLVMLIFLL
jgi:hypothetical protein